MPYVGSVSNCGGNNAARVYVREHVLVMTRFAEEGPYHRFSLAAARPAI
jgi:hypothetical protein